MLSCVGSVVPDSVVGGEPVSDFDAGFDPVAESVGKAAPGDTSSGVSEVEGTPPEAA